MENPEQEEKPDKFAQEFTKLDNKITEEITTKYSKEFEEMLRTDEWKIDGQVLHANMLSHDKLKQMDELRKEEISEEKDWDKYIANYKKRAAILIKEIQEDPSIFDKVAYYPLENLLTAWSRRTLRGFHLLDKSV